MSLGIFSINDTIYFRVNAVNKQGSGIDATSGPDFKVFFDNESDEIVSGTMNKIGSINGFYEGSFLADETVFSVGQFFILIEATVDGETPKINIPFQLISDDISIEETFQEIETISTNIPSIGTGSVSVDHNYGSTDKYRVLSNGTPLADVEVRAFVASDYELGRNANKYVVGQTRTITDGRWASVIRLDPGDYILEFSKIGQFKTKTTSLTVSGSVQTMSIELFSIEKEPSVVTMFESNKSKTIAINHNYKSKNHLLITSNGKPVEGVEIKAFYKSNYDEGKIIEEYVLQRTISDKNGKWKKDLILEKNNEYVIEFSKKKKFTTITVVLSL